MTDNKLEDDEFALGALALVFSVGFLKANELFDYFDRLDVFVVTGQVLHIHFRELLALVGFALAYIVFLFVAGWGTYRIYRRRTEWNTDQQQRSSKNEQTLLVGSSASQAKNPEAPPTMIPATAGAAPASTLPPHPQTSAIASPKTLENEPLRQPPRHAAATDVLVVVMLALVAAHFFSLCGAYSHLMHKYSEQVRTSPQIQWDLGS